MTVLLTGAAGKIGAELRERLPKFGWTVRCFDRVAVVHFAGVPTEMPWPQLRAGNVDGLTKVFAGMLARGFTGPGFGQDEVAARS